MCWWYVQFNGAITRHLTTQSESLVLCMEILFSKDIRILLSTTTVDLKGRTRKFPLHFHKIWVLKKSKVFTNYFATPSLTRRAWRRWGRWCPGGAELQSSCSQKHMWPVPPPWVSRPVATSALRRPGQWHFFFNLDYYHDFYLDGFPQTYTRGPPARGWCRDCQCRFSWRCARDCRASGPAWHSNPRTSWWAACPPWWGCSWTDPCTFRKWEMVIGIVFLLLYKSLSVWSLNGTEECKSFSLL